MPDWPCPDKTRGWEPPRHEVQAALSRAGSSAGAFPLRGRPGAGSAARTAPPRPGPAAPALPTMEEAPRLSPPPGPARRCRAPAPALPGRPPGARHRGYEGARDRAAQGTGEGAERPAGPRRPGHGGGGGGGRWSLKKGAAFLPPQPSTPAPRSPLTRRPGRRWKVRRAAARAGPRQRRWDDETATVPWQLPRQGAIRPRRADDASRPGRRRALAAGEEPRSREPPAAPGAWRQRRQQRPQPGPAAPPRPPRAERCPVLLPRTSLAASAGRERPLAAAPRDVRRPPRAIGPAPCVYTQRPPIRGAAIGGAGRKGVAGRDPRPPRLPRGARRSLSALRTRVRSPPRLQAAAPVPAASRWCGRNEAYKYTNTNIYNRPVFTHSARRHAGCGLRPCRLSMRRWWGCVPGCKVQPRRGPGAAGAAGTSGPGAGARGRTRPGWPLPRARAQLRVPPANKGCRANKATAGPGSSDCTLTPPPPPCETRDPSAAAKTQAQLGALEKP